MNFAITLFGKSFLIRGEWTPDLEAHEQYHARRQREVGGWKYMWLYISDPSFRYTEELAAYRVSIMHGMPHSSAVRFICTNYFLDIPEDQVRMDLFGRR